MGSDVPNSNPKRAVASRVKKGPEAIEAGRSLRQWRPDAEVGDRNPGGDFESLQLQLVSTSGRKREPLHRQRAKVTKASGKSRSRRTPSRAFKAEQAMKVTPS